MNTMKLILILLIMLVNTAVCSVEVSFNETGCSELLRKINVSVNERSIKTDKPVYIQLVYFEKYRLENTIESVIWRPQDQADEFNVICVSYGQSVSKGDLPKQKIIIEANESGTSNDQKLDYDMIAYSELSGSRSTVRADSVFIPAKTGEFSREALKKGIRIWYQKITSDREAENREVLTERWMVLRSVNP